MINASIIEIYNLEIDFMQNNIEDFLGKTRYILDSNIEKDSFKLIFFWNSIYYVGWEYNNIIK